MADAFNFPAVPRSEYRHNILKGVADWMRSRQNTEWAKRYSYVHLLVGWADDLDRIRQELEAPHEAAVREIDQALAALADVKPLAEYGVVGTYDTVQARRQRALTQAEQSLLNLRRELAGKDGPA